MEVHHGSSSERPGGCAVDAEIERINLGHTKAGHAKPLSDDRGSSSGRGFESRRPRHSTYVRTPAPKIGVGVVLGLPGPTFGCPGPFLAGLGRFVGLAQLLDEA